jgi:hypothetical protein
VHIGTIREGCDNHTGCPDGSSKASGFIYRSTNDTPAAQALTRWAREIVPAVREAIGK